MQCVVHGVIERNVASKIIDYVEHNAMRRPRRDRVGA